MLHFMSATVNVTSFPKQGCRMPIHETRPKIGHIALHVLKRKIFTLRLVLVFRLQFASSP